MIHVLKELTVFVGVLVVKLRSFWSLVFDWHVLHFAFDPSEVSLLQVAHLVVRAEEGIYLCYWNRIRMLEAGEFTQSGVTVDYRAFE